jgi:hypothetical protein
MPSLPSFKHVPPNPQLRVNVEVCFLERTANGVCLTNTIWQSPLYKANILLRFRLRFHDIIKIRPLQKFKKCRKNY